MMENNPLYDLLNGQRRPVPPPTGLPGNAYPPPAARTIPFPEPAAAALPDLPNPDGTCAKIYQGVGAGKVWLESVMECPEEVDEEYLSEHYGPGRYTVVVFTEEQDYQSTYNIGGTAPASKGAGPTLGGFDLLPMIKAIVPIMAMLKPDKPENVLDLVKAMHALQEIGPGASPAPGPEANPWVPAAEAVVQAIVERNGPGGPTATAEAPPEGIEAVATFLQDPENLTALLARIKGTEHADQVLDFIKDNLEEPE